MEHSTVMLIEVSLKHNHLDSFILVANANANNVTDINHFRKSSKWIRTKDGKERLEPPLISLHFDSNEPD